MKDLRWRFCVAPMMDRNDSITVSISCEAACAVRVHEGATIYFAHVRCNAIFARPGKTAPGKCLVLRFSWRSPGSLFGGLLTAICGPSVSRAQTRDYSGRRVRRHSILFRRDQEVRLHTVRKNANRGRGVKTRASGRIWAQVRPNG